MISFIVEFYNQPELAPDSTWCENGIVYPYTNNDLYQPRSIFVDKNDADYVSFYQEGIVIVWSKGNETPWRIYHGNSTSTNLSSVSNVLLKSYNSFQDFLQSIGEWWNNWWKSSSDKDKLAVPNSLFVTSNGDIYVGQGSGSRIVIWKYDSTREEILLKAGEACYGLFVDTNDTIYCSLKKKNQIKIKSIKYSNTTWTIRASEVFGFVRQRNLDGPYGIFVHMNFGLYVTEYNTNKILLFEPGQTTGRKLVENNLNGPTNIVLDIDANLYIVDSNEHRVVFVAAGEDQIRCLVGCPGNRNTPMRFPTSLSFDSFGNILVSDTHHNRVLKFQLEINSCGKSCRILILLHVIVPIFVCKIR